jgi:hypothetical protein
MMLIKDTAAEKAMVPAGKEKQKKNKKDLPSKLRL